MNIDHARRRVYILEDDEPMFGLTPQEEEELRTCKKFIEEYENGKRDGKETY